MKVLSRPDSDPCHVVISSETRDPLLPRLHRSLLLSGWSFHWERTTRLTVFSITARASQWQVCLRGAAWPLKHKTSAGVSDQICDGEKQMLFYEQKQTNVILHNESLETSFPAISWTWSHRYYLNWTELDDAITEFNNEMHSADNWVLHFLILHYWHTIFLFWYCAVLCYNLYC